ncbi:bestrophin family protein [Pontibacter sp. 13R65]|uniref:bestrophin family protein n=1 Tax=Pontibacter sp. 13R65 TaxID=3127458 RepID=UPI00301C9491
MLIDRKLPPGYIIRKIKKDVFRVLLFSVSFHLIKLIYIDVLPDIPLQLPTILGTAISLILAFNVNQSYDRWWEARKIWGAIVNDSRSLILQLKGFINENYYPTGPAILEKMAHRQIAWCYCLGQSLRGQTPLTPEQEKFLPEEEVQFLSHQSNKSFALLMLHMHDLQELRQHEAINPFQEVQINSTITRLCDSMGKAERINSTVFPITYRLFIHVFMYIFLIVLSIALVETVGVFEIPILIVVASTFFLIEKTARHMQDPFRNKPTDTPVTAIARTIEINIRQILMEKDIPKPHAPEKFYLM